MLLYSKSVFGQTKYCIAGNFRQEFNFVEFRQIYFLTKLNSWLIIHKTTCAGSDIFVSMKINDKQKINDWTIKEKNEWWLTFDGN